METFKQITNVDIFFTRKKLAAQTFEAINVRVHLYSSMVGDKISFFYCTIRDSLSNIVKKLTEKFDTLNGCNWTIISGCRTQFFDIPVNNFLVRLQGGEKRKGSRTKNFDNALLFILHQKGIPWRDILKFFFFTTKKVNKKSVKALYDQDCFKQKERFCGQDHRIHASCWIANTFLRPTNLPQKYVVQSHLCNSINLPLSMLIMQMLSKVQPEPDHSAAEHRIQRWSAHGHPHLSTDLTSGQLEVTLKCLLTSLLVSWRLPLSVY